MEKQIDKINKLNNIYFKFLVISGIILSLFCCIGVPIIIYHSGNDFLDNSIAMDVFSIDWTIFGILVAGVGISIAVFQKNPEDKLKKQKASFLTSVVIEIALLCILLCGASTQLIEGNTKLFTVLVYSSLYFVSMLIVVFLLQLLHLFVMPVINQNN